jgi:ABC-type transporter Mla subunit MlaD
MLPTEAAHTFAETPGKGADMPTKTATKPAPKARPKAKAKPKSSRNAEPVERLDDAIKAAQDALTDLRKDLSRGQRDLVRDVDKTLKDARGNLKRIRRTLVDDLDKVGKSVTGRNGARKAKSA